MSHTAFVLFSYGATALVFLGLVAWLLIDRRSTIAQLARLEAQGVKRRSEQ